MPSSTSSSDRPGLRLTASDRPGVAQPVPERDIPDRPWRAISFGATAIALVLLGSWEWYWRDFGAHATQRNSEGLWATQRRRLDSEPHATVITGASRMLFDIDLDTWQRLAGDRPIQLALEGTSPLPILEDIADHSTFAGRLVVGVAPDVFFSGFAFRAHAVVHFQKESPAERVSQWISSHTVEPYLAFYDPDFSLPTVVLRQDWPAREGISGTRVRKLSESAADRNTWMWSKVETDTVYRDLCRRIWAEDFAPLDAGGLVELDKSMDKQINRAVAVVAKLRARGVLIVFVRAPSDADYLAYEERNYPRARSWDVLLAKTGVPGIHFADYPELQGYELPEWSHLAAHEKPRFTEALYRIVARDIWKR